MYRTLLTFSATRRLTLARAATQSAVGVGIDCGGDHRRSDGDALSLVDRHLGRKDDGGKVILSS